MTNIGIIGAGSWGTALGNLIATNGHEAHIWDLDSELLKSIAADRENKRYLPGVTLHDGLAIKFSDAETVEGADLVLFAVPAQHFRAAVTAAAPHMRRDAIILNVAKGIERESLMTISQIAEKYVQGHTYAVLSGPSHAEEVGLGMATTVAVASNDMTAAEYVQDALTSDMFRVYTNSDVIGLELGGSLKNVIALGAGITDGMGLGDNTKAALMTRGIAEMTRLGVKMGAEHATFSGLSGIGDLIVTCTSMHSRNRRCGIQIGQGTAPDEAVKSIGMVVEGVFTADAAVKLAHKVGVELPITESVYHIINGDITPKDALKKLMERPSRHEREAV